MAHKDPHDGRHHKTYVRGGLRGWQIAMGDVAEEAWAPVERGFRV